MDGGGGGVAATSAASLCNGIAGGEREARALVRVIVGLLRFHVLHKLHRMCPCRGL